MTTEEEYGRECKLRLLAEEMIDKIKNRDHVARLYEKGLSILYGCSSDSGPNDKQYAEIMGICLNGACRQGDRVECASRAKGLLAKLLEQKTAG